MRDPTFSVASAASCIPFQSTGPLRDPTARTLSRRLAELISIHRSLAGPDRPPFPLHPSASISIHRSLAGPDGRRSSFVDGCSKFQSTGPLRDPTYPELYIQNIWFISIHRSLAGPDSTTYVALDLDVISIHRSLAGPDKFGYSINSQIDISIHRSLAGPDLPSADTASTDQHFNPQVPCGTRRGLSSTSPALPVFQSTGPLRDPTKRNSYFTVSDFISIHRSLAGPDAPTRGADQRFKNFNPQVPCGTRLPAA